MDSTAQTTLYRCGAMIVGLDATPTGTDASSLVVADFTGSTVVLFGNTNTLTPIAIVHSQTLGSSFQINVRGKWEVAAEVPVATAAQVIAALNLDGAAADLNTDPDPSNTRNYRRGAVLGAAATTDTIVLVATMIVTQDVALDPTRGFVRLLLSNGADAGATAASLAPLEDARVTLTWVGDVPPGEN